MKRAALVLSFLIAPSLASAQPGMRFAAMFSELVDGEEVAQSVAEQAFVQKLLAAGVRFIDEQQAIKLRSVTSAGDLIAGKHSDVLTALDADVLVAARVRVERVDSSMLGSDAFRYRASVEAKMIATDTGDVLGAFSARGGALAYAKGQAVEDSARKAGEGLAERVLAKMPSAQSPRDLDLTIRGLPGIREAAAIKAALASMPGVTAVRSAQSAQTVSKLQIRASGTTAEQLALTLDARRDLALAVVRFSDRVIEAQYAPARAVRLSVVVSAFAMKRGAPRDRWKQKAIPGALAAALANAEYLDVANPDEPAVKWRRVAKTLDAARTLVLLGGYRVAADGTHVTARLETARGLLISSEQATCPEPNLSTCVARLGDRLREGLVPALRKKGSAVGRAGLGVSAGSVSKKPLQIEDVAVADVFPARLASYGRGPLGHLVVKNTSKAAVTDVVLQATLAGFSSGTLDDRADAIPPGQTAKIPIRIVLDPKRLETHEANQPATLSIGLSYRSEDYEFRDARSEPVVVFDKNAMDWSTPDSAAAFVTPRAGAIIALSRQISAAARGGGAGSVIGTAAAAFEAMAVLGIRYAMDPVAPYGGAALDYLQFPAQTLKLGGGDCDDLAVLYASIGSALGLRMLLVTTPQHVFAAAEVPVPLRNLQAMGLDAARLLEHDGHHFVPVETTRVGHGFSDAWSHGIAEIKAVRKTGRAPGIIDLAKAWRRFGSVDLQAAIAGPTLDTKGLGAALSTAVADVQKARAAALEAELTSIAARAGRAAPSERAALAREQARLLAALDRHEEARRLLEAAGDPASLNNLGNVLLESDDPGAARSAYERALALAPSDSKIRFNAALAAWAAGDEAGFMDHVVACLSSGATDEIEALATAGLDPGGSARGAEAGARTARDLSLLIEQAYERAKTPAPAWLSTASGQRAREAGAGTPMTYFLYWL